MVLHVSDYYGAYFLIQFIGVYLLCIVLRIRCKGHRLILVHKFKIGIKLS